MNVYIARTNKGHENPGELVGIFAATNGEQLFWLVDECCTPGFVEVAEIGTGGIYWSGSVATRLPDHLSDDEIEFEGLPSDASLCENWCGPFLGDPDLVWKQIPASSSALEDWELE